MARKQRIHPDRPRRGAFRKEVFARELLIDDNATRAARVAGAPDRSARQQGYELRNDPEVIALVNELREAALKRQDRGLPEVLDELNHVGFSRVREIATVKNGKLIVRDLNDIPERAHAAIAQLKQVDGGVEVKLHPKVPALIALGKHHGMKDTTRHEHGGIDGAPIATEGKVVFYLPDNGRRPKPTTPPPEPSEPSAENEPESKG